MSYSKKTIACMYICMYIKRQLAFTCSAASDGRGLCCVISSLGISSVADKYLIQHKFFISIHMCVSIIMTTLVCVHVADITKNSPVWTVFTALFDA